MSAKDSPMFLPVAFAIFFVISILFSFLINGLLLKFSRTLGNRQMQNRHTIRWSNNVKPSVGGFSFYILFLISISIYGVFNFSDEEYLNKPLLGMIAAVSAGFMIGLADDAYNTIPLLKFFSQLFCAASLIVTGTLIPATGIYVFDVVITLIWVVGIMNSINMLDNMDGISGTVSLCVVLACFLVLVVEQNVFSFYSLMLISVGGAVAGFLCFNWHPARIYMGDTGSQFLGAFISAMSIPILWKYHTSNGPPLQLTQFLIPAVALTVPIIDTATVFMRRLARGQSPFIGGKDHISHHFVYAGLNDKQVIYLLGGWSLLSAGLTAYLVSIETQLTPMLTGIFCIYMFVLFIAVQIAYDYGTKKEGARIAAAEQMKQEIKSAAQSQSATA